MGQCIKCGRQAKNCYEYLTADVLDVKSSSYVLASEKITETTTTYGNFEYHQEFLCSRHQLPALLVMVLIAAGWSLITVMIIISRLMGNPTAALGMIVIFFVITMIFWIVFIVQLESFLKDKPSKRGDDDLIRIRKKQSSKAFFTVAEFEELKKKNPGKYVF